jgi:hypothetical protein
VNRSPCIGCYREHMDKNTDECKWCDARCRYVLGIEHGKFNHRPAAGNMIRYGGNKDMTDTVKTDTHKTEALTQDTETKACRKCGETKPLDPGYHKSPGCKDGHEGTCKACKRARARELRKEKKQAAKAQAAPRQPAKTAGYPAADNAPPPSGPGPAKTTRPWIAPLPKDAAPEKGGIIPIKPVKPAETGKEPDSPEARRQRWEERTAEQMAGVEARRFFLGLDFVRRPELLEAIREIAAEKFRGVENHIMYLIDQEVRMDREEKAREAAWRDSDITPWAKEEQEI